MLRNVNARAAFGLIALLTGAVLSGCTPPDAPFPRNVLRYDAPAESWETQAMPIGNGRLGAMVFGDPRSERIQLNEDSMWPGGPEWGDAQGTREDLEHVRRLIREGSYHEADSLWIAYFSHKSIVRSHQTMGDLFINFDHEPTGDYERTLDLDSALVSVRYGTSDGVVTQRAFASYPDDAIIVELRTTAPGGLNFSLSLTRPDDHGHATATTSVISVNTLQMDGMVTQHGGRHFNDPLDIAQGVRFQTRVEVINAGGSVAADGDSKLTIAGAKRVRLHIVGATSFYGDNFADRNKRDLDRLHRQTFSSQLARHVADYQSLFNRVKFDLEDPSRADSIQTDLLTMSDRLARIKSGARDLGWIREQFQMGRYLLIASSRPGTNPANLQGLWNEYIEAPWNADYHLNINLQMNYWPAEVTNLSELTDPLFDFTERLLERGRATASEQYNMRGTMAHHATDLWAPAWMRAAQPYWGAWTGGGAWLGRHLWEHYLYSNDEAFLRDRAYPLLHDLALFYVDWLVEYPDDGKLVSSPSTSPENSFIAPDGKSAATTMGAAIDQQLIAEVFTNTLVAADVLGIDDPTIEEIRSSLANLRSGTVVGADGRLLEWDKPFEEAEPGHRHMSHVYAFHPGNRITRDGTPELYDAVKKTLQYRLDHGGAGTGWSRAWLINMSARLGSGADVENNIDLFLQKSVVENLFDMHPPFQIDGNFGFTAGVAEALLQSHAGFIELLPALPESWPDGRIRGLKARGNVTIDMDWKDGDLTDAWATSADGGEFRFRYRGREEVVRLVAGRKTNLGV